MTRRTFMVCCALSAGVAACRIADYGVEAGRRRWAQLDRDPRGGPLSLTEFDDTGRPLGVAEERRIVRTPAEWEELLTARQFQVTRQKGTERAFTGEYNKLYKAGLYRCIACGTPLFSSAAKFDSETGWPSFRSAIAAENIRTAEDRSLGLRRTEVLCARCDAHLGHVFNDGPAPSGLRYCINSAALAFIEHKRLGK